MKQKMARLCRRVGLCPAAQQTALAFLPAQAEIIRQYQLLQSDPKAFFAENDEKPNRYERYLALFAAFAVLAWEQYEARGIAETVYVDTMRDLARWEEVCFERYGVHGLKEVGWLQLHVQLKIFALGQLQFEPLTEAECELPPDVKGLRIFNVHIPKGADLSQREASYRQALDFFDLDAAVGVCHSWLLSPKLRELLPPSSRILAFQGEYQIVWTDEKDRQAEERIFGHPCDDYASYPENSALQKAAKAALMRGEKIPVGYGYRRLAR